MQNAPELSSKPQPTRAPTRREILRATLALPFLPAAPLVGRTRARQAPIDRRELVSRHDIVLTAADLESPLQVGNGELAMTVDVTGLQTLFRDYERGMPLGTLAQWAWHAFPPPAGVDLDDIYTLYASHGRMVPYADGRRPFDTEAAPDTPEAAVWRRANPHRVHLGRLAFVRPASERAVTLAEVKSPLQELHLWSGTVESRFRLDGELVEVTTVCHPRLDAIAVRVRSVLLRSARLGIEIAFPYPAGEWRRTARWDAPDRHQTRLRTHETHAVFDRTLDATTYRVHAVWAAGGTLAPDRSPHHFTWTAVGHDTLELTVAFSAGSGGVRPPDFASTQRAAAAHWETFWTAGGAVDLSASTDRRAPELERRIVCSQYLTAVNCAGSVPPQETGLVTNSWYGKHHLEMHWWHAAHFVPWGRRELLERSLPWYRRILPEARALASRQGYRGARWPKQVGPDGRESPSGVAVFLIWQQPHPIFFAELLYRASPGRDALERHAEVVFDTAEFMASFAAWDTNSSRFVLGPPLIPAQESYGSMRERVSNPTFELAYWHWGLSTAQTWRERMGLARHPEWDRVLSGLARPRVIDGVYAAIDVPPFTIRADHPSMLAALGMLPPTPLVDAATMRRTLADVRRDWDWKTTWGWDYPMMAMTAARLGVSDGAVDALLLDTPKNRYLPNGHNMQTPARLPLYLPGNGGLLYAVAMMAGGWDGAPARHAPGFPADWHVRTEGLGAVP